MDAIKKLFSNNLGTKAISILIGFVLWSIVLGSRTVVGEKEIPINLITADGLVIANPIPLFVRVRFSGPKARLRTILNRSETPIRVDLSQVGKGTHSYQLYSDAIHVPLDVEVESMQPSKIVVELDQKISKTLRIETNIRGKPGKGFKVGKVELLPTTLKVSGPKGKLRKIKKLIMNPVDVSEMIETGDKPYSLDFNQSELFTLETLPVLTVQIEPVELQEYTVSNVKVEFLIPDRLKGRASKRRVKIVVRADPSDWADFDKKLVNAQVDLNEAKKGTHHGDVTVQIPSFLELVKIIPPKIKVRIY